MSLRSDFVAGKELQAWDRDGLSRTNDVSLYIIFTK